jgi:diadenosine tetraphosphate (Ap4A) HIT family hydrolase
VVNCPLCQSDGGSLVWRGGRLRVIIADDPHHPAFTRVVWHDHVREMTDLSPADRDELMSAVWTVESVQREILQPDKINLASLGNLVPHLHWHVIPRWPDDRHYPAPVWGQPAAGRDQASAARAEAVRLLVPAYIELLNRRLG